MRIYIRYYETLILVAVPVAQRRSSGIQNIPNPDSGANVIHIKSGVEGERAVLAVNTVDRVEAVAVGVLPDAEVTVDESVVQPEGWVGRRTVDILHDGTDTIVSPSVGATFSALPHAVIVGPGVALVDIRRVAVGRLGAVAITSQAMNLVARAGTDVDGKVGKLLFRISILF